MWGDVHKKLKQNDIVPTMDAEKAFKIGFEEGVEFMKVEFDKKLTAVMAKTDSQRITGVWRP